MAKWGLLELFPVSLVLNAYLEVCLVRLSLGTTTRHTLTVQVQVVLSTDSDTRGLTEAIIHNKLCSNIPTGDVDVWQASHHPRGAQLAERTSAMSMGAIQRLTKMILVAFLLNV